MENIQESFSVGRDVKFVESRQRNSAVVPENYMETLERSTNTLHLEYVKENFNGFTASEKAQIDEIAAICPLLGGNAVFRARSLQSSYTNNIYYNDKLLCNQQGVYYRLAATDLTERKEKSEKLLLFPNPSSSDLNVFLDSEIKENYSIQVFNLPGQLVYEIKNVSNKTKLELAHTTLSTGSYILVLTQLDTGKIFRDRFVYED